MTQIYKKQLEETRIRDIKVSRPIRVGHMRYFLMCEKNTYSIISAVDLNFYFTDGVDTVNWRKKEDNNTRDKAIDQYISYQEWYKEDEFLRAFEDWRNWSDSHIFAYSIEEIGKKFKLGNDFTPAPVGGEICDYCGDCENCLNDENFKIAPWK